MSDFKDAMNCILVIRLLGLSTALSISLVGCQQLESLTSQFQQTVTQTRSDAVPSCDPSFSLAGFFDDRPEILIEKPARNSLASDLRRIAVIPPSGDGRDEFTRRFESALASVKVGDQPYFQVVSQTEIEEVLAQQGLRSLESIDIKSATKAGRVLGLDGVYIPQIVKHEVNDSKFQATGSAGQCTKRTVDFEVIPKLVDVSTGQVVYADAQGGSREERYCPRGGDVVDGSFSSIKSLVGQGGLAKGTTMMSAIIDEAMTRFVTDVAPQVCMKKMNIMVDPEGLSNDETIDQFEAGVAYMVQGRYDRACPAWQHLETSGEEAVSLYNNLAICAEIEDELVVALEYCSRADALLSGPSEDIGQCIESSEKRLTEYAALRASGCGPLNSREDVREAQELLADLGYLQAGTADGIVGPFTLKAVIDFQADSGLPIEGRVDTCLLSDLRSL